MSRERFTYSRWRHGGWYVHEVRWPNGGCGCVYRHADGLFRIACDSRPFAEQTGFKTREGAALEEQRLIAAGILS